MISVNWIDEEIPEIRLYGKHGCYDKEKKEGQLFKIAVFIKYLPEFNLYFNIKS